MADVIIRFTQSISFNQFSVPTSARQISGGPAANWPLATVSATFFPSYHRVGLKLTNVGTTTLYFAPNNTVDATHGTPLLPGNEYSIPSNGSVLLWVISPGSTTGLLAMEELG